MAKKHSKSPKTKALLDLSSFPILDSAVGIKMMQNNQALKEMLQLLQQESLMEGKADLEKAYQENNWSKIFHIAHKIEGGCLYVGTIRLKYACHYLEQQRHSSQPVLSQLFEQLLSVIESTHDTIQQWLEENR